MPWHVYKFGGSSLGGPGRLLRVVELVASAPRPLALVVSALGDTTDWLLAAAAAAATGDEARGLAEIARIRTLASETARQALPEEALASLEAAVEGVLAPLAQLLQGIRLTGECTPSARDVVLSAGERIAAVVVASALCARGHPALAVNASAFVVTDETAGAATVDVEATRERLAPLALGWEGTIPVVTGFIGRSREGRVTTLGRNGSDYTATVLGQTLGAGEVTVWTDVPGVMTADPQLVAEAYSVPHLSYHEALELAHFGTRMFHPRTFLPLLESGARLRIRNTADPEGQAPASTVRAMRTRAGPPASPASNISPSWASSPDVRRCPSPSPPGSWKCWNGPASRCGWRRRPPTAGQWRWWSPKTKPNAPMARWSKRSCPSSDGKRWSCARRCRPSPC